MLLIFKKKYILKIQQQNAIKFYTSWYGETKKWKLSLFTYILHMQSYKCKITRFICNKKLQKNSLL